MSSDHYKFRGFISPNSTQVPDALFDELLARLSGAELKVVLYIIRRTFGFKKEVDNISLNQISKGIMTKDGRVLDHGTGLSQSTVLTAVKGLLVKEVVVATRRSSPERGNEATTYSLNFAHPFTENRGRGGTKIEEGLPRKSGTQQTVLQETDKQQPVVVAALRNFGISKPTAEQLAQSYPEPYILEKLDFVQWLKETRSALVTKSPAGYLRRALEEDYQPPPTYKPPAQRKAEAERKVRQLELEQQERREAEEQFLKTKEQARKALAKEYPPELIAGTK